MQREIIAVAIHTGVAGKENKALTLAVNKGKANPTYLPAPQPRKEYGKELTQADLLTLKHERFLKVWLSMKGARKRYPLAYSQKNKSLSHIDSAMLVQYIHQHLGPHYRPKC